MQAKLIYLGLVALAIILCHVSPSHQQNQCYQNPLASSKCVNGPCSTSYDTCTCSSADCIEKQPCQANQGDGTACMFQLSGSVTSGSVEIAAIRRSDYNDVKIIWSDTFPLQNNSTGSKFGGVCLNFGYSTAGSFTYRASNYNINTKKCNAFGSAVTYTPGSSRSLYDINVQYSFPGNADAGSVVSKFGDWVTSKDECLLQQTELKPSMGFQNYRIAGPLKCGAVFPNVVFDMMVPGTLFLITFREKSSFVCSNPNVCQANLSPITNLVPVVDCIEPCTDSGPGSSTCAARIGYRNTFPTDKVAYGTMGWKYLPPFEVVESNINVMLPWSCASLTSLPTVSGTYNKFLNATTGTFIGCLEKMFF